MTKQSRLRKYLNGETMVELTLTENQIETLKNGNCIEVTEPKEGMIYFQLEHLVFHDYTTNKFFSIQYEKLHPETQKQIKKTYKEILEYILDKIK